MLKEMLSRLEPVHIATTREEREAIYRFRYQVYYEEFGRQLGSPDHQRRWVTDGEDELAYTTLLYTGTPERIAGTLRLRCWGPGEAPAHDVEELSMDRVPGVERYSTAEMGRLMIRPSARGKRVVAALIRKAYELYARVYETDLVFCYCSSGLVRYYQRFGMRPYGGRPIHAPDGIMLPLMAVISDWQHQQRARSFLAPLARRCFANGRRPVLDTAPFEPLFEAGGLEIRPGRVWNEVKSTLLGSPELRARSLFNALPEPLARQLAQQGLITDIPAGILVTRKGFCERELFVVLDGQLEVTDGELCLGRVGRGELFGEDALLAPSGRRTASVRAITDGRVLVLRGKTVEKLLRARPELAPRLRRRLETLFASRSAIPSRQAAA
jgi:predicted GNAT family N-acyltransferase